MLFYGIQVPVEHELMLFASLSEQLEYQIVVYPMSIYLFVLAAIPLHHTHSCTRQKIHGQKIGTGRVCLAPGRLGKLGIEPNTGQK